MEHNNYECVDLGELNRGSFMVSDYFAHSSIPLSALVRGSPLTGEVITHVTKSRDKVTTVGFYQYNQIPVGIIFRKYKVSNCSENGSVVDLDTLDFHPSLVITPLNPIFSSLERTLSVFKGLEISTAA